MIKLTRLKLSTRRLSQFVIGSLLLFCATLCLQAQTMTSGVKPPTHSAPAPQPADSATAAGIDEVYELNIGERHYDEQNFAASTAITTAANSQNLNLQVGVALSAKKIIVVLRNITGVVRFRGNLDRVLQVINDRPHPPAENPQALPN